MTANQPFRPFYAGKFRSWGERTTVGFYPGKYAQRRYHVLRRPEHLPMYAGHTWWVIHPAAWEAPERLRNL